MRKTRIPVDGSARRGTSGPEKTQGKAVHPESSGFWRDRATLVTGATGLLGSWVVKRLITERADVTCVVRDWVPQSEMVRSGALDRVKVARGDVKDQAFLERVMGENEIDTVFHLAAQPLVPVANRNAVSTFESNIQGTWCVMEACRRSRTVKQVVTASSDKAYGEHDRLPYTEETPLRGTHPYDVSKSCADLIAQVYARHFDLHVVITRCGNIYGGGDLNWNRIIPGTIRSVLRGQRPIIRSDGRFIRDYFYVEDTVEANISLAERLAVMPNLKGHAFNFSYERPMTVFGITKEILRIMSSRLVPRVLGQATGEIRKQYLSAEKARKTLGWTPAVRLEEGLRRTIGWYEDFFGRD